MASQNDLGFKSFLASGAISAYVAVDVQTDGTIKACANGVSGVGVLQEDAADANYAQVKLWSAPGTFLVSVSGTAVTPATTYSIITGGYAGPVTTGNTAVLKALGAAVASNGIVQEFAKLTGSNP
jgi:hypothetical protein